MKLFEASFHTFLVHQMNSNFAYVFFRQFAGDNFLVFGNFEKMTRDLWHFESSLRYENFWSFVFYISSSPNEFKFCIRLLQTFPGENFFVLLNFDKNDPSSSVLKAPWGMKIFETHFYLFLVESTISNTACASSTPFSG